MKLAVLWRKSSSAAFASNDSTVFPGSSDSLAFAPAIEYNWNGHVGVIFGVRLVPRGRNTSATITPATAVNLVY